MEIFQAIILGIIEGLTEFLPISSTGHLIIAENVMGYKDTAELFTVVIQIGAISAVIWFYRKDIIRRIAGLVKKEQSAVRFWINLALGTIPAALLALLLDSTVQSLAKPAVVALMLILGGFVFLWVENNYHEHKEGPRRPHHKDEARLDDISHRQALGIGAAQAVALIPGVSRSGASIIGGLLAGLDRVTATAFSFYLSIPIMVLATGYKLIKEHDEIINLPGGSAALIAGTAAAFITALMAISWLLRYISTHNFKIFAYYRIGLGVIILLFVATRLIR